MNILESFRIIEPVKLAAVGAGGKSSFLFALARELNGKCIITTTTHLSIDQSYAGDLRIYENDPLLLEKVISAPNNAVIVIIGLEEGRERVSGPTPDRLEQIHQLSQQEKISLLVEADGSKKLPLKAFANHEPVVPEWIDIVVHVIGWNVIGKPVNEDSIFRIDRYCELSKQKENELISLSAIVKLLLHDQGGKKAVKNYQRSIIFFNQCPTNLIIDNEIEREVYSLLSFHHSIIFGNTNAVNDHQGTIFLNYENIAAVILAAGGSSRLGKNKAKQLLQFKGKSFLQNTVDLAINGYFSNITVVLGYMFEKLQEELKNYPINIVTNKQWKNGQSTSVIASVNELLKEKNLGGALFIPIDQPYLDHEPINQIVRCHTKNIGKAIIPQYQDISGAPVLFDRNQLEKLLNLEGDKGGRSILQQVPHTVCHINNPKALMDIDTMEDYEKIIAENQ